MRIAVYLTDNCSDVWVAGLQRELPDTERRLGAPPVDHARDAHLVEADLIPLLDAGQLAGATLDVFEQEPLPADHPFWRHPKINVTPHTSARTLRETAVAQIAGKIRALEAGVGFDELAGVVDAQRGY